jgi:hypothetical protein
MSDPYIREIERSSLDGRITKILIAFSNNEIWFSRKIQPLGRNSQYYSWYSYSTPMQAISNVHMEQLIQEYNKQIIDNAIFNEPEEEWV